MNTDKKLLNRSEAAHYLGLVEHTLAVWACHKTHEIPYIKIGRNVRYRLSDLDAWLESRTVNNQEKADVQSFSEQDDFSERKKITPIKDLIKSKTENSCSFKISPLQTKED